MVQSTWNLYKQVNYNRFSSKTFFLDLPVTFGCYSFQLFLSLSSFIFFIVWKAPMKT